MAVFMLQSSDYGRVDATIARDRCYFIGLGKLNSSEIVDLFGLIGHFK